MNRRRRRQRRRNEGKRIKEKFCCWSLRVLSFICNARFLHVPRHIPTSRKERRNRTKRIFSAKKAKHKTKKTKMRQKRIKCAFKLENRKWRFAGWNCWQLNFLGDRSIFYEIKKKHIPKLVTSCRTRTYYNFVHFLLLKFWFLRK